MSFDNATGRLTIGARSGSFKGMVENRTIKVRFIGSGAKPVDFDAVDETVAYSGQPVVVTRKK
jgi:alpha-D-xyloside xylohydrolase